MRIDALSPLEVYHAIKAVGASDAGPILAAIGRESIQVLFDLDVWQGDMLEVSDVLVWLQAFREASFEAFTRAVRAVDEEAIALALRARLEVALRPHDEEEQEAADLIPDWVRSPSTELDAVAQTSDGRFWVAARRKDRLTGIQVDEEERKAIVHIVDELYRDDEWEDFAKLLRLAHDEMSHELAENAYRFRVARLEDLGFPPPERAQAIYQRLDPSHLETPSGTRGPAQDAQLPHAYAAPLSGGLFGRAMNELVDPRLVRRIEGDLVPLANAVLAADGIAPANQEAVQESLLAARGLIDLALQYDVSTDRQISVAIERLTALHVTTLFRVGYDLTVRLKLRADAVASEGWFAANDNPIARLDAASRSVVTALRRRRPRVSTAIDPRSAAIGPYDIRPFQYSTDVDTLGQILSDLEELGRWMAEVGWLRETSEQSVDALFATAVMQSLVTKEAVVAPLTEAQFDQLAHRVASDPSNPAPNLSTDDRSQVMSAFAGAPDSVQGRVQRAIPQVVALCFDRIASSGEHQLPAGIVVRGEEQA